MFYKKVILMCFVLIHFTNALAAFDFEKIKNEITDEISPNLKANSNENPILILIGGYPCAGKTTLIEALHKTYDIDVIQWNSIRQALLDRNMQGSSFDWEIIEAVNRNLFKNCLKRSSNIIIDANAHANNIKLFETLLKEEQTNNSYKIFKICLNPSVEVLMDRMLAREQKENVHQGTALDLRRDLDSNHKRLNMSDYELIIRNDKIDFQTELNIVKSFLKPYLH